MPKVREISPEEVADMLQKVEKWLESEDAPKIIADALRDALDESDKRNNIPLSDRSLLDQQIDL